MARRANVAFNILVFLVLIFLSNINRLPIRSTDKTKNFNFTARSTAYGYITDEHTVTTDDGYILTVFRMRSAQCKGQTSKPIVLMHGVLMSSDTWLDAGTEAGIGYLLSDACFDVWAGNVRGNHYGRRHVKFDPDKDSEFWDFSADEMGAYDIPATVKYVLEQTGKSKVDYMGYSQGAGVLMIMCSERPSLCDKVNTFVALAPATQLLHTESALLRWFANLLSILVDVLSWFRIKEMFPKGGVGQALFSHMCEYDTLLDIACKRSLTMLDSDHKGSIKTNTLKIVHENFPTGTSVRTFARYGQALWRDGYQKYDYGENENLKHYGTPKPPYHNLSAVNVPTVVLYGKSDRLVGQKDVEWLVDTLPNVLEKVEIQDPLWNHFDFMYSHQIKEMVLPTLLKYLSVEGS